MESRVFLDSEVHFNPKNVAVQDGKNSVALSTPINIVPPQPAKKPTRQWAAWTRQEEESFFTALRQVGKNFEKITCRVQSKNKDQVRHYYYRLVRRMNKLLGPGLYLDAKNSKDTNTAMLRWWSLLEKYSCKASKLHLKPRRFKIFVEALEHQLMKDRKKSVSKRPTPGEDCPLTPTTVSNQGRVSVNDNRAIKLVLVDSKNIQKGPGKSSLKRNVNMGINHGICKGDSTIMKSARQRRKPGVVSSASYKKWEKAAMAGVSLVADAAEHLERTTMGKEAEEDTNAGGQKSSDCAEKVLPTSFGFAQEENYAHSALKLKLQLFPIDDGTRRALEMDKHNPHLELTLSTRKKISSVAEHLNRKWGNSSVASGVILLFPYDVQRENLVGCQRWTLDSIITAADVYAMIGSPQVFRLRYGWFSSMELRPIALQEKAPIELSCISGENNMNVEKRKEHDTDLVSYAVPSTSHQCIVLSKDRSSLINKNHALDLTSTYKPNERERCCYLDPNNNVTGASYPAPNMSGQGKKDGAETAMRRLRDADDLRPSNGIPVSAVEWADSLTNISIGDLLSGASQNADCINQTALENSQCLQQIPFSCDSFDAAIAAHLSRQQEKMGGQPILASHASSSIWDAEETCDAFSFQKNCIRSEESLGLSGEAFIQNARMSLVGSGCISKDLPQMERATDPTQGEPMEECQSEQLLDNPEKEFSDLADMYWPESLGLDLDMPSSKYQSQEFILSDSLSGLNRLIASSVDAFQNCSFFGLDKKEPASSMEARETETASFSDFKIGSGV